MAQINKPDTYFNTVLYTGNGSTQSITGVGFQPDATWIKERNNAHDASIMDVVRGVRKSLTPSNTEAEYTETTGLSSWDSDGFSFDGAGFDHVNTSGDSFVAWNWLASNTTASNTDGSITSTVSANTTSGFSIVTYTGNNTAGATVGHGLGSTPQLIIIKNRDSAVNWQSYHEVLGNQAYLRLNTTGAASTGASIWNNTSPTSSVFTLGSGFDAVNGSGNSHVAYCFAEKKGFSKFGSYTGNGSADGTFIYTGFKPAWFLVKESSASGNNWYIWDNKRDDNGNPMEEFLIPNLSNAEGGSGNDYLDFVSNGIKTRNSNTAFNNSGSTYIYMAFASEPLVGSNNVPATAR